MLDIASRHEHVQPIPNTVIIQVAGNSEYEKVQLAVMRYCKAQEDVTIRFVMSPLMHRGLYYGRMPQPAAEKINRLTD